MGLPNRELYLTKIDDKSGMALLSAWIPVKKPDGLYYHPKNIPIGLDIWVPNLIGLTNEDGPAPVKVVPSDADTGLWLICLNDYFGDEQHLFTTKPIHKEDKYGNFKGWRDWEFPNEDNDINEGFGLHVYAPDVKSVAGDGPIPVTFARGHAEYLHLK